MKIIIDAFGGDNSPDAVVLGANTAVTKHNDIEVILCGDEQKINETFKKHNLTMNEHIKIVNAQDKILGTDDPVAAIKEKTNSSMVVGLNLLKDGGGDAFLSAGNSGALLTGGTLIVKRLKGIKRAAMAPVLPTLKEPAILIDAGANVVCRSEYYKQFALMGSIYMESIFDIKNPPVGLINIGVEETKGTETVIEAYHLLKEYEDINFKGNLEVRDVLKGDVNVMVADGWTGNVVLKVVEGTASVFMQNIKNIFKKNILTKMSALMIKDGLVSFKKKYDYKEYGGSPIMGLNAPVFKAHGSSDAKAFYMAILQAKKFVDGDVINKIKDKIGE